MVEDTRFSAPRSPRAVVSCPFCSKLNRVALDRVEDRPRCGECGRPLDSDRNPTTATELGIRGIPTSIVFVAGREAARQTGAVGRRGLEEVLARASEEAPGG